MEKRITITGKILIIDDQADHLGLLVLICNQLMPRLTVLTAQAGKPGLEIARKERPDVVLLDIRMPDMSGYKVCQLLKVHEDTKHIPIVMFTGVKADSHGRVKALESGADAFLSKPIDQAEMVAQVNAMLRMKKAEEQLRKDKEALRNLVGAKARELKVEKEKQKKSEEKIQLYADIVENMQVGLHLYRLEDPEDDRSLRMVAVNPAGAGIIGLTEPDLVGKTLDENFPGLREKGVPQGYAEVVRTGKPIRFEDIVYEDRRVLRAHFVVRAFPLPGRHVGVMFEDISQQKRMEEELKESEAKFRDIFNNVSDGIFMHELTEEHMPGRFLEVNDAACRRLGYTREEFLNMSPMQLDWNEDYRDLSAIMNEMYAVGHSNFERIVVKKDGARIQVEVSAHIFYHGKEKRVISIVRDITERKKAEAQIKRSLEEKELLLKEIHHRVKNNLSMVSGLLNIQSGYIKDKQACAAFAQSRKRIKSIAMIHEKLYHSKDLENIEFQNYIHDLAGALIKSSSIPRDRIELIVDIHDIYLHTDAAIPLGLIITELVTNSLKYGIKDDQKLTIAVRMKREDNHFHLTVGDNGPGIDKNLDWRNTQTLGIQLVTLLTRQLSGEIHLERKNGSFFRITFPYKEKNKNMN